MLRDSIGFAAADGFVVQTGDPEGPAEGFIDPSTEKTRTIPLEIMVEGEKAPFYGETLEVSPRNSNCFTLPINISTFSGAHTCMSNLTT